MKTSEQKKQSLAVSVPSGSNVLLTFRVMSFAVVATGFLTLIFTGTLSVLEIVLIIGSLAIGWLYGDRLVQIPRADSVATAAIIAVFVLSLVGFFFFDRSFVGTTTTFLIAVQSVRVLFLTEVRHYLQAYLISLFSVLVATVLTFSPAFLIFFVIFLLIATAAMILLTMIDETRRIGATYARIEINRRHLVWYTLVSVFVTIVIAGIIFVFFPRLSAGFLPSSMAPPMRVPGFSNNVELGEVGDLKITSEIIMRVVVSEADVTKLGRDIYWRGTSFDVFDGRYWEKSTPKTHRLKRMGDRFIVKDIPGAETIHLEYYLEPTDGRVLFFFGHTTMVVGPFMGLDSDRYGTIMMPVPINDKLRYTTDSVKTLPVSTYSPDESEGLSETELSSYLKLPDNLDPRIPTLTREIVGNQGSPVKKAELIGDWLKTSMTYDLNPKVMGNDPLTDFLFVTKRGYCEHFATALAIMLRVEGVPSRVVTGFLSGEYNRMGSFYTVRSSDAHAWVEAYIGDQGWVVFEATPSVGLSAVPEPSALRQLIETLVMKWYIYVVNYDMSDQLKIVETIRDSQDKGRISTTRSWGDFRQTISGVVEKWPIVVTGVVIIACAVLLFVLWQIVRALVLYRGEGKGRGGELSVIYRSMVSILGKHGYKKTPTMTPREYSRNAGRNLPDVSEEIDALTELYYQGRFGLGPHSEETVENARGYLKSITDYLRRK